MTTEELQSESTEQNIYVIRTENKEEYGNLVERIDVDDTPFKIIKILTQGEEKDCFISIGDKRITEMITEDEAKEKIQKKDWQLMVSLIAVMTDALLREQEKK